MLSCSTLVQFLLLFSNFDINLRGILLIENSQVLTIKLSERVRGYTEEFFVGYSSACFNTKNEFLLMIFKLQSGCALFFSSVVTSKLKLL